MDIAAWALFAISVDLLLGYTGLLSFGHAAFWGTSAYTTGLIATKYGVPFPVAILGGAVAAMVLAVPIGYLSVKRTGIYFAMVTLAFAQMVYFIANQWRSVTGGENGLQGIPKNLGPLTDTINADSFYFYYAALPIILLGVFIAWRTVNSPFGRVLVAIRDNPARARALGYDVERYKIMAFVLSAGLAGLAGGVFSISHGFASLQELIWTTSGKVVLITVLGGIGTLWGAVVGAALVVTLEDQLASSGFNGIGIVTGTIFVVIVLAFRHGIWGTARNGINGWIRKRRKARES
jgi:branched-chain amino acid transport system permease protein